MQPKVTHQNKADHSPAADRSKKSSESDTLQSREAPLFAHLGSQAPFSSFASPNGPTLQRQSLTTVNQQTHVTNQTFAHREPAQKTPWVQKMVEPENNVHPSMKISPTNNNTVQRRIDPHPDVSGDFIIQPNPGVNDRAAFIRQIRTELGTKVMRARIPALMARGGFQRHVEHCWDSTLSLQGPRSRQIVVRLDGWGERVSRFRLISPAVQMPEPDDNSDDASEPSLPPLQRPQPRPTPQGPEPDTPYQGSRELLLAFILGTSLYDILAEPLHGELQQGFGSSHPWTQQMRQHPHMASVRQNIRTRLEEYCSQQRQENPDETTFSPSDLNGQDNFSLNSLSFTETVQWLGDDILNWLSWGELGQESAYLFGSFRLYWAATECTCTGDNIQATILFFARDSLHLRSATRIPLTNIGLSDEPLGEGMPLNNVDINWYWRENWISTNPIVIRP